VYKTLPAIIIFLVICLYSTLESRYYIVALQREKKLKRYLDQGKGIDGHLLGELGNDVQADKCAGIK